MVIPTIINDGTIYAYSYEEFSSGIKRLRVITEKKWIEYFFTSDKSIIIENGDIEYYREFNIVPEFKKHIRAIEQSEDEIDVYFIPNILIR